ncbi:MAG: cobalamin-binding protein [Polyangia bacterium]
MKWLAAIALLSACHRAPKLGTRTVTDGLGRSITVAHVQRVISLAPSSTEIIYALGAGDRVVGVDRYSDWPEAARKVTQVGTDMEPSLERMVTLHPDLVLVATTANAQRAVDNMAAVGLSVYVSRTDSLEQIFTDIEGIGRALERTDAATALVAALRARVAKVPVRAPPIPCAIVVWPAPLVVAGRGNHVDDLLRVAGCRNVVDDGSQPFPTYSTERLVKKAPEVVFVGTHATGAPSLDPLLALDSIPAVKNHRVHTIDGDLLFRPGPRVVEGIEALARLLP